MCLKKGETNNKMATQILIMVLLVLLSAFFSATETAFSSLNKTRLKSMSENGNRKAERALRLAENYDELLSTILIGNNIVNIAKIKNTTVPNTILFSLILNC